MEYVPLGRSSLSVSRLGFGCDPLGGHAWGHVDTDEAIRAIDAAVDRGVTLFDTADCYGLGESERILGRALAGRRDEVVVASKFGVRVGADGRTIFDNSAAWLDAALDASLSRLGTDRIDLYQIHYWDGATPLDDVFGRLDRKRDEGKIACYGISNIDLREHGIARPPAGLATATFEYSLANRAAEAAIGRAATGAGLTFLSWGSLGQGVLTGKYDRDRRPGPGDRRRRPEYGNFHGRRFARNLAVVEAMREIGAHAGGRTPSQVAMRWILDRVAGSVVLAGIKSRDQLAENIGATGWRLDPEDVATLDRLSAADLPEAVPAA